MKGWKVGAIHLIHKSLFKVPTMYQVVWLNILESDSLSLPHPNFP